jgi:hypothetical protein
MIDWERLSDRWNKSVQQDVIHPLLEHTLSDTNISLGTLKIIIGNEKKKHIAKEFYFIF